jgi:hypothetical protein
MSVHENRLSLGRRQCAEQRRYLAGLESLGERLRTDELRLRAEIQLAAADGLLPEAGAVRPVFAGDLDGPLIERHTKLARSVAAIDAQIAEAGAALGAAEQALKRYELAAAQHAAGGGVSKRRRARRAASPIATRNRGS